MVFARPAASQNPNKNPAVSEHDEVHERCHVGVEGSYGFVGRVDALRS